MCKNALFSLERRLHYNLLLLYYYTCIYNARKFNAECTTAPNIAL